MAVIAVDQLYTNGRLFRDMAAELTDGQITNTRPLTKGERVDGHVALLTPGFTDLQVNGGGGVMLNSDPTAAGMRAIAAAHRRLGTTWVMPTLITDHPEVLDQAVEAALDAHGRDGVLGLHIEGPHINVKHKGTHDPARIRPLDQRTMGALRRLRAGGVPVILTLAPELADPALLAEAAALGVVISAGHTAATADEARAGLDAGVGMFTHLFNAMPQMQSRAPGIIATAILSEAWCGFIADGIHVSWEMLRIAMAARPRPDRMFLVSDAMATVGGPDHFTLYGQDIFVRDGRLVNAQGSLAGAHIDMRQSVANLVTKAGVGLDRALWMAVDAPRLAMGMAPAALADGWIALDDTLALTTLDHAVS